MAIGALSRAVGVPIRRVIFSGGRDVGRVGKGAQSYGTQVEKSQSKIFEVLDGLGLDPVETTVVHGGAKGLDDLVGQWAQSRGFAVTVYPANWDKWGKAAGTKRNWQMLLDGPSDLVVAFPGGKGTQHMRGAAKRKGVPLLEVDDKLSEAVSLRGVDAVIEAVAKKYAPLVAQAATQSSVQAVGQASTTSVAAVPAVASTALAKDFANRLAKLRTIVADEATDQRYAESQYNTIKLWIGRNMDELDAGQLDELRPLVRELAARGTPQYSSLQSFTEELDDLMGAGLKRSDLIREFKDLNVRFLEYVDTMGTASTGPILANVTSRTLARFSGAAQELGAVSAKGTKIGAKAGKLKAQADELLDEASNLPAVKATSVKVPGGVKDRLDDFVDEAFDTETIREAKKGIGIGRRAGPDGEVKWDVSPEDILQISSREEEAVRAGAGRFSRTEQQSIDKINKEIFSDEAALDKFVDRDSPLSRAVEAAMGRSSSPDRFVDAAQYRAGLARDLATGNYTVRKLRTVVRNPLGAVDEKGKPVGEIVVERVQKVRVVDKESGAYEIFNTEVYHNGQKLTGSRLKSAFGACPHCGVIYPTGTPGICSNPACYTRKVLKTVAKKTEQPATFLQDVDNFLGQGPLMSRLRESLGEETVERIVIVADPNAKFSNAEISRFLELLDLPYDVKVIAPARGGVEDFVGRWFVNRNVSARSEMRKRIGKLKNQGHDTTGMPHNVPDANVERMRLTSDIQITPTRSYPEYKQPGGSTPSGNIVNRYSSILPSGSTYGANRTVLMAFGDNADVQGVLRVAKRMRLAGDPIRIVNVGKPDTSAVLSELRPNPDSLRYLVNRLDVNGANVTEVLTGNEALIAMRAQQDLLTYYPGVVTDKLARTWRGHAGSVNEYGRQIKLDRLEKSRARIIEALSKDGLPSKTRRSMERNLKGIQASINRSETFPIDLRASFGEGIYLPGQQPLGKATKEVSTRRDMLARLKKNQDVSLKGRKLSADEKRELKKFLEEVESWVPRRMPLPARASNPRMSDQEIIARKVKGWEEVAEEVLGKELFNDDTLMFDAVRDITFQFFKNRMKL